MKYFFIFLNKFSGYFKNPDPAHLMLFGVCLMLGILICISSLGTPAPDLKLEYSDSEGRQNSLVKQKRRDTELARMGENDATLRLAARVSEANAVMLGLLQHILHRRIVLQENVSDIKSLMIGFEHSDLLPPFAEVHIPTNIDSPVGRVVTARGAYYVRYRANPLLIEIVASGRDYVRDGSLFIIRAPDSSALSIASEANIKAAVWATLYTAPEARAALIPPPFAPAAVYQNYQWQIEPLRVTDVSPEKLEIIKKMLSKQS